MTPEQYKGIKLYNQKQDFQISVNNYWELDLIIQEVILSSHNLNEKIKAKFRNNNKNLFEKNLSTSDELQLKHQALYLKSN